MEVDINGLPFTYENKDELVFPESPPIPVLETLRQDKEMIEWEILKNQNDLKEILAKIKEESNSEDKNDNPFCCYEHATRGGQCE